jgi:hypothetical protein
MMGLTSGLPALGLDPDSSSEVRAARLWPIVGAMARNLLEETPTHPTYLLEGDMLLPRQVAELQHECGTAVRACFLGYTAARPDQKLRQVRAGDPSWYTSIPEADVLAFLDEMVRFSRLLERECAAHGLPYVDCSAELAGALDTAERHLLAE